MSHGVLSVDLYRIASPLDGYIRDQIPVPQIRSRRTPCIVGDAERQPSAASICSSSSSFWRVVEIHPGGDLFRWVRRSRDVRVPERRWREAQVEGESAGCKGRRS
ncbi:hypothetical protein GUJ93_ZPchr0006g46090 [Zizania palustris]|uniref:Uncharacterized protein n=1 Tax=Zizania palustris TaxID=103762 RepID=A0A8J5VV37_ZIZPA|nr:hypothetical protein GUJ93_ZPchr0006g46090 [Zizania palustris]